MIKTVTLRFTLIAVLCLLWSLTLTAQSVVVTSASPASAGSYFSLAAAFTAINNGSHQGTITITITGDLNTSVTTATATINASGTGSASYGSIRIVPSGHRTITGNFNNTIINLNGADNVTIEGLNTSSNSLTIQNTHSAAGNGSVLYITGGASNNTIKNCTLLASCFTTGVIIFNGGSSDNDNDSIANNNIGSASSTARPWMGIIAPNYSGVSSYCTNNIVVYNNNIYDFSNKTHTTGRGISIGTYNNNWKIYNNRFYQTASMDYGTTMTLSGIYYANDNGAVDIRNNVFGGANSSGTGTCTLTTTGSGSPIFYPINILLASASTASNIQGNIIKNIYIKTYSTSTVFAGIIVSAGKVDIGNISGNSIGDNTSTNSIVVECMSNGASNTWYGIYIISASVSNVQNNIIGSSSLQYSGTSSNTLTFYGIYYNANGNISISGNTIGSSSTSSSIYAGPSGTGATTGSVLFRGIFTYGGASPTVNIQNNIIANITGTGTGTSGYLTGIYAIDCYANISGNTIQNISTNSANTNAYSSSSVLGIFLRSLSTNNRIVQNIISGLRNTNSSIAVSVLGIYFQSVYSGSTISLNNITDIGCTGTAANITKGILSYYDMVSIDNNFICFNNNLSNSIRGIELYTNNSSIATELASVYYNTIYISGTNTLTGETSCIFRNVANADLRNNILYNSRSSSGNNLPLNANWATISYLTCNYNLLVCPDTSKVINWGGTTRGWSYYTSTINTVDKSSYLERAANLAATSLFTSPSTGDLSINSSNVACWYVNGKGMPISGYDFDYQNSPGDRSTSVSAGATDIGAHEFYSSTTPPAAVHSGTFTAGSRSTYTFGGRTIAVIEWTAGSTLPSSPPVVRYYSGTNPANTISGRWYYNCYWDITPPNQPAGLSYKLTLYYSDALLYSVSSASNVRLAKNSTGTAAGWSCQCNNGSIAFGTVVNTTNKTLTNFTPFTSFSIFTGTDASSPLPVEFISFTATRKNKNIQLDWATANEINCESFEMERSYGSGLFEKIGQRMAKGGTTVTSYQMEDATADLNQAVIYYRLKLINIDGSFDYSSTAVLRNELSALSGIIAVPNPFSNQLYLQILASPGEKFNVSISDVFGKQVWQGELEVENNHSLILIPGAEQWNKGTYYINAVNSQLSISGKILKTE